MVIAIFIYIFMAKTIMIPNELYKELKIMKGKSSFTKTIKDLINSKEKKLGSGLKDCLGILNYDYEWKEIEKTLKKGWKDWSKKYA